METKEQGYRRSMSKRKTIITKLRAELEKANTTLTAADELYRKVDGFRVHGSAKNGTHGMLMFKAAEAYEVLRRPR